MPEFEIDGTLFRTKRLSANAQWRLYAAVMPLMPAITGMEIGIRSGGTPQGLPDILEALRSVGDDATTAVFALCRDASERRIDDRWMPVDRSISLPTLISLCLAVVQENLGPLFALDRPNFRPISSDGFPFEPVGLPHGKSWLFRPVQRGMCRLESIYDGTLRIEHIAEANDACDCADENEARARKAAEQSKGSH